MQDLILNETLAIPVSEFLFEEKVFHAGITEYGISLDDLSSGKAKIPPEGVRFDIAFQGTLEGPKIKGRIKGVDFLDIRADGRHMLNLQAIVVTDDGANISLYEDGIMIPDPYVPGNASLRLNMRFKTAHPKYTWLNMAHVWGIGEVDMGKGEIFVKAYIP